MIRAFCREREAVKDFDESNRELTRLNEFVGRLSALLNPATYVLINIATVFLISAAGVQVNMGSMQQGETVALYNYMAQMIVELIKLASLIITLNKAAACAGRVADILNVQSSMDYVTETKHSQSQTAQLLSGRYLFLCRNQGSQSFQYQLFRKKGQTVGIIGGTGSGKQPL